MKTSSLVSYRAKTSALNREPMRLPKCGTLFTYGNALVINTFRVSGFGKLVKEGDE